MRGAVLVTEGNQRSALAIVRSLGRRGHDVVVCSSGGASLAGASRWAAEDVDVPDPIVDPHGHAAAVSRLLGERDIGIAIPTTEASLLSVLPLGDRFPDVIVPFPDISTFAAVSDKTRVFEAARQLGIPVPEEVVCAAPPDLAGGGMQPPGFPLVVKPGRSLAGDGSGRRRLTVGHASDHAALAAILDGLPAAAYPVHLQRRVEGPGVGIFLLVWDGELIATFAHRRLREKPPSGGVSVYRESIAADPELVAQARALLEHFRWNGVAMVEFKVETGTGRAFLMEVNGRFWGSLQLAVDAGVDFPRLLVEAATGARPDPIMSYRRGVKLRWFWGDVDHLAVRLRRSRAEADLTPEAPGRIRTILDFLIATIRARDEVLRWSDPRPALREAADWLRTAFTSARRRADASTSVEERA